MHIINHTIWIPIPSLIEKEWERQREIKKIGIQQIIAITTTQTDTQINNRIDKEVTTTTDSK